MLNIIFELGRELTLAPAPAWPNPPVFNPALLRQLCGPAGAGASSVGAGPLLDLGVAPGLPFAPLQPAYAAAAGFCGFARGAWGV